MMLRRESAPGRLTLPALALAVLASTGSARAQAWVGPAGGLDVSLDYNLAVSDTVIGDGDVEFPDAGTTTHQITLGAEYTPIEKLAVGIALPMAVLKYTGSDLYPHPGGGSYDDGDLHATLTDLRAGARYQLLDGVIALSPHIGFTIPVADYETIGNTVAGRHLKAAHLGLSVGKVFMEALYVHLTYEFSLVEKYDRVADTAQYGQNRSDVGFTVGYQLMDGKLDLSLSTNGRITHDGVSFNDFATFTPDEVLYHDAVLKEEILLAGVGVGYRVSDTVSTTVAGRLFVAGNNTQNASVIALGLTWSPEL